jgi:DNA-binding transcriptional ArsR family regulator
MPQWAFLTNHALVLSCLARDPLITAIEISNQIGVTERAVRKIIADLTQQRYIVKKKEGRRVRYKVNIRMPLRHKTQKDILWETLLGPWRSSPNDLDNYKSAHDRKGSKINFRNLF